MHPSMTTKAGCTSYCKRWQQTGKRMKCCACSTEYYTYPACTTSSTNSLAATPPSNEMFGVKTMAIQQGKHEFLQIRTASPARYGFCRFETCNSGQCHTEEPQLRAAPRELPAVAAALSLQRQRPEAPGILVEPNWRCSKHGSTLGHRHT